MNILCSAETKTFGRPRPEQGLNVREPLVCPFGHKHVPATAYLAGPMRGIAYWNFPAFDAAQAELKALGWTIHSPAEHDREIKPDDIPASEHPPEDGNTVFGMLADCLKWDFARIAESSCIIVLPGWEMSTGCHWEFTVAYALGKPVYQYPDLTLVKLPKVITDPVKVQQFNGTLPPVDAPSYAHMRGVDGPGAYAFKPGDDHPLRSAATDAFVPLPGGVRIGQREAHAIQAALDKTGEVRVSDPATGGAKGSKPERFDLIPADVMEELARHYGRGCRKYADRNWEKGYKWSLSLAALQRHLNHWEQRRDTDNDPEVGDFPHLIAVVWHACALMAFQLRGIGTDDRPA